MQFSFVGVGKMVARLVLFLLSLSLLTALVACVTSESVAQEPASRESGADTFAWQEIAPSDMKPVIQLLSSQTKSNYEKIRTWRGTIHRKLSTNLSESQAIDIEASLAGTPVTEVYEKTVHFAVDFLSDKRFVSQEDSQLSLIERETGHPIPVEDRGVVDECFIITPEDCVLFQPSQGPAIYKVVQDHPDARDKRAAFREARESDSVAFYARSGDPRLCFGLDNSGMKFWRYLDMYVESLEGKGRRGSEGAKLLRERLRFYQAAGPGGIWYREDILMGGAGGDILARTIWSPEAGLYPVEFDACRNESGGRPVESTRWEFKKVDDIWIPTQFCKTAYEEGAVSREDTLVISDNVINVPIPSSQFEYAALGLKDGDLVMDRIEDVCYIMRDGVPEKLAGFNEKYVPPEERTPTTRRIFLVVGVVLLVAAVVFSLLKRTRARAA